MLEAAKINWPVPEGIPVLHPREIHLWCAWLGQPDDADPAEAGCLSPDEITRAGSFHFAADRHRYVAARRNLRRVLAGYAGWDPAALVFSYGRFGKPSLVQPASPTDPLDRGPGHLAFNQSHCGPLWLLAVAWNQPVGVDVEAVKDLADLALIESRIFSAAELRHQQALPAAERQRGFFHRWTQREAAVKFQGLGLDPSDSFDPPDQSELLAPTDGYVGCLAYGGASVRIQRLGWDPRLLHNTRADPVSPAPGLLAANAS